MIYPRTRRAIIRGEDARSPAARPAMQRFGFLRRTGSGVGGDDDASDAVDAKHGSPHKSRGSTSSTAGVGSDHADDGSSDSGSDDSRATTVVKHSHNHSISSQHSVGDYPEWLHRDERDPRGSSSSTAGTHTVFPGPPAGPLHRVDSRTHINEALHTVPGLRNRGIDLPMTRRLAFRKCRGVARSRSLALIIFAFVAAAFLAQPKPPADVAAAAGTRAVADARWRPATGGVRRAGERWSRGDGDGSSWDGGRGVFGDGTGRDGGGAPCFLAAVARSRRWGGVRVGTVGGSVGVAREGDRDAGEERMGSAPGETFEGGDPRRAP